MLNTSSWPFIHAMQHLLKTFYYHSVDQWPTFIFEKMTHNAICTLAGDMHIRNVITKWHHNSLSHVKIRNSFKSYLHLFWCVFGRHHVTLTNFDLMVRDRSDRSWRENHHFVTPSRHEKLKKNTSESFFLWQWQLGCVFCTQSLDQWPMFIFIKMTHSANCTRLWVTWLWNVHTTYYINSDRDSKKLNFSRGPPEVNQCHFR